jgi:hypothetical protein
MNCARRARAALGRGDHQPAIARAEVDDEVARRDLGEVEHFLGERRARRHPDHVLAGLALVGLETLRLRRDGKCEQCEQQRASHG